MRSRTQKRRDSRKLIVFFERIASAEEVGEQVIGDTASTYREMVDGSIHGWKGILHSDKSADDRKRMLEEFSRCSSGVMFCCRVLDEGYDVPEIDGALLVASTKSMRQRIQRIGRALRAGKGKKKPIIITLYVPGTTDGHVTHRDETAFAGAADIYRCTSEEALHRLREILK